MMIPKSLKSNRVTILKDPFHDFDTFSQISQRSSRLTIPNSTKSNKVRILKDPSHHCHTYLSFFSGVLI